MSEASLALVVGGVVVLGSYARQRLNTFLQERLAAAVGPGTWSVDLQASWLELIRGRAAMLDVRGENVQPPERPQLARFGLQLRDLRIADGKLAELGSGTFAVTVTQDALNAWLPKRPQRGEHEPEEQVTLTDGRLEVRFVLRGGRLSPPVTGTLHASGATIDLTLDMTHLRAVLPERVVQSVEKRTLVDLSDTPLGLDLTTVRVERGAVVVEGTLHPTLPLPLQRSGGAGGL